MEKLNDFQKKEMISNLVKIQRVAADFINILHNNYDLGNYLKEKAFYLCFYQEIQRLNNNISTSMVKGGEK